MDHLCLRGKAQYTYASLNPERPHKGSAWWVLFVEETIGCVSVMSDYGHYNHIWHASHTGYPTTAEFLTHCGESYLLDKFTYGFPYHLDEKKTQQLLRHHLLERRRQDFINEADTRVAYDAVSSIHSTEDFNLFVSEHGEVFGRAELRECHVSSRTKGQPEAFVKRVWPSIRTALFEHLKLTPFPMER